MRSIAAAACLLLLLLSPSAAEASAPWRWPVEGPVITPYANGSDPYAAGQHRGIDVAAPVGAQVVAASAGTVTFAGPLGSSGVTVAIRTDDGFDTSYLHLSSTSVRAGDRVAAGAPVGRVGTTGRRSAVEPHLHFGVREAGSRFAYRDPLDFLPVVPAAPVPRAPLPAPATARVRPRVGPPAAPAPLAHLLPRVLAEPATIAAAPTLANLPSHAAAPPVASIATPRAHAVAPPVASIAMPPAHATAPPLASLGVPPHRAAARTSTPHAPGSPSVNGTHGRAAHRRAHDPDAGVPRPAPGPSHPNVDRSTRPAAARLAHGAPRKGSRGVDVGWLVACVAMVAAAAILGRPRATGRSLGRAFDLSLANPPDRP